MIKAFLLQDLTNPDGPLSVRESVKSTAAFVRDLFVIALWIVSVPAVFLMSIGLLFAGLAVAAYGNLRIFSGTFCLLCAFAYYTFLYNVISSLAAAIVSA
ncbi:MAG: hypothetical protein LBD67_06425 [Candidatus Accumulibacter sp.]|nr:hypothetical protein [Accumulibacter sp.]